MMTRIAVILVLLVCIAMGQNHNSPLGATYECVKDAFVCGDEAERCISNDHVCDGYFDCQNGKDEENCAKMKPMSDVLHADDLNPEIPTFGLEMGPVRDIPSHNRTETVSDAVFESNYYYPLRSISSSKGITEEPEAYRKYSIRSVKSRKGITDEPETSRKYSPRSISSSKGVTAEPETSRKYLPRSISSRKGINVEPGASRKYSLRSISSSKGITIEPKAPRKYSLRSVKSRKGITVEPERKLLKDSPLKSSGLL